MLTLTQLFELCGGVRAAAERLGRSQSNLYQARRAGVAPITWTDDLKTLAAEAGVEFDDAWVRYAPAGRRPKRAAKAAG